MNRIILSLDNQNITESIKIAKQLQNKVWGFKLRNQIYESESIIPNFKEYGNVMVDFKLFDNANIIEKTIQIHYDLGVDITTVHCSSLYKPLTHQDIIAGITILSSMKGEDFKYVYNLEKEHLNCQVGKFTYFAKQYKYGYIVCLPSELKTISKIINPSVKIITLFDKLELYKFNDNQAKISIITKAIRDGSHFLIIDEPILNLKDINDIIEKINKEIESIIS